MSALERIEMAKTSGKSGGGKSGGGKSGAADKTSKVVAPAPKVAEALLSTADEKDSWDESALDDNEYARFVTRNEEAGEDTSDIDTNPNSLDADAELSEGDGETSSPNGDELSEDELSEEEVVSEDELSEEEIVSEEEVSSEDEIAPDGGDWTLESSESDWVDLSDSDPAAE